MPALGRYIVDAIVLEHRSQIQLARDHRIPPELDLPPARTQRGRPRRCWRKLAGGWRLCGNAGWEVDWLHLLC